MNNNKVVNVTFKQYTSTNPTTAENVIIYPNPFDQQVTIQNAENIVRIRLTNLIGQKLAEEEYNGSISVTLETGSLPKGIYLIVIQFNSGYSLVKKIVKE